MIKTLLLTWLVSSAFAIPDRQIYCLNQPIEGMNSPTVMEYAAQNCNGTTVKKRVCMLSAVCSILTDEFLARQKDIHSGKAFSDLPPEEQADEASAVKDRFKSNVMCAGEERGGVDYCPRLEQCKEITDVLMGPHQGVYETKPRPPALMPVLQKFDQPNGVQGN